MMMPQSATILKLSERDNIRDLQFAFSTLYPYLRIEFHRHDNAPRGDYRKYLSSSLPLSAAGLRGGGEVLIRDSMTVEELEIQLRENFGLIVRALRKSGNVWLEINMSGNLTLERQNQNGRELSQ